MTVLEDGAGGDRHLVSAPAATPAVSPNRPSLSPCAPRAHPSGGPAQGYKILGTGLVAVEALLQLQQSPGIILAHDHEHYMLGLVASSKYPYKQLSMEVHRYVTSPQTESLDSSRRHCALQSGGGFQVHAAGRLDDPGLLQRELGNR